jgi:hypothetical protein
MIGDFGMSEFNGLNYCNNAIKVDFVRQTVKFSPIPKSFFEVFFDCWLSFLFSSAILSVYVLVFVIVFALVFGFFSDFFLAVVTGLFVVVVPIVSASIFSLGFFVKSWREHSYPEFNARMALFSSVLTGFRSNKTFLTVNPNAIVNNCFFVPIVSNVVLEYEATLDFAFYLESVEVVNRYLGMDGDWFVVIRWSQLPVEGFMKLSFD